MATVDHAGMRGSGPHHRDPSGATSDEWRGFGPEACRIAGSRVLLSVGRSAAIVAAVFSLSRRAIRYAAMADDRCRCSRSTVTPMAQMKPKSSRPGSLRLRACRRS